MLTKRGIIMKLFVGVDVGKYTLDVCYNNNVIQLVNDKYGLRKFHSMIRKEIKKDNEVALILCEATGGYEVNLVKFAKEHNLPIRVEHANKVRNYAKSKGLLAKTDKIDARLLSEYAETMKIEPSIHIRSAKEEELCGLVKRREQLITDKVREMVRLDKELNNSIRNSIKAHIKWLEKEMKCLTEAIKKLQEEDTAIDTKVKLLTSIPAIGEITAYSLIAFLPELGHTTEAKRMSALAGLAPYAKDSGKYKGKRFIQGGRSALRRCLYMSALSATIHYKEMKEFYHRLKSKGKPTKVALIAVARKLLSVLNSVMSRYTPWVKEYGTIQNMVAM
jgi:transposase